MLPGAPPLVFGSLLAGGTSLALAGYAWRARETPGSLSFALLMLGAAVWSLSYGVAVVVFDPALRLLFEIPIEVGKALVAPAWLAFALAYTGRGEYLTRWTVGALLVFPAATLVVVAVPSLQPLIWTNYHVVPTMGAATVSYDPTAWYYAHAVYGYVLVGVGMALLVDTVASQGSLYREGTLALVVGSAVPTVAHVKRTVQLGPLAPVDFTPMALAVTGLTFTYALFQFDLFDLVPATSYRGRRAAVDDLGVGVAIVAPDDRVVELNREAERLFSGVDAAAGDPLSAFVPAHAADGGTFDVIADGQRRTVEAVPADIDAAHDRTVGRSIAFHDVTDREARRQRLAVLNRVLRHNLRNEMTVVMGYAGELADSLPDAEARMARTIERRSAALASLGEQARELEAMLDVDSGSTSTVVLDDLVSDVVTDAVPGDADADLDLDVPAALAVETNERVLRVVVETLVENAVEHNDASTPWVGVSARHATTDGGETTVGAAAEGVVLTVRDNGPGIPPHELAAVDDGAETALNHGSGLGLWVVHWGSRWLGADVDFETDSTGTTVRLRL
jgi:signal transduction histidine kinase